MQPAFSSTRQALLFGALLLVLIALPALLGHSALPPRATIYTALPDRYGPFPFIHRQIFEEKGDIDMVFAGSSHIWSGIDTPAVQQALGARLGREAKVITLGWPWSGFDAVYFITRDLLEHRHVRMLVINDEFLADDTPHRAAHRWFRYGDDAAALDGLPWRGKAALYGGAVLGLPRNLLALLRQDRSWNDENPIPSVWKSFYRAPDPGTRLGALSAHVGYDYDPGFAAFHPPIVEPGSDAYDYHPGAEDHFRFGGRPTQPYQRHFVRKLAELARAHGTQLVFSHLPTIEEASAPVVQEREFWPF